MIKFLIAKGRNDLQWGPLFCKGAPYFVRCSGSEIKKYGTPTVTDKCLIG